MDRDIGQVPLKHTLRAKLLARGHERIDNFEMDNWEILTRDLGITEEEAKRLIQKISGYGRSAIPDVMQPVSAWDLWEKRQSFPQVISTGCRQLNNLLDGGIPVGSVVELCGVPGIGKTQLCMQLCVNVQIPKELGGMHGSAIFIDTDGGLVVERLQEIAKALVDQCKEETAMQDDAPDVQGALQRVNLEEILSRIWLFRCNDYLDIIATVHLLPELLKEKADVKLIVIDSIASHFRYAFEDLSRRAKILNGMTQKLATIAIENKIAVVLTNQMTTRITPGEESRLVPALGTSWGYACAVRLNLFWKNDTRVAHLFKSPSKGEISASFIVVPAGIRDLISMDSFVESDSDSETTFLMSSQLADDGDDSIPVETEVFETD